MNDRRGGREIKEDDVKKDVLNRGIKGEKE